MTTALRALAISSMVLVACTPDPDSGTGPAPGSGSDAAEASVRLPSDAGGVSHPADASVPLPPRTFAPTYTAVWDEILAPSCAWLYCHGGSGLLLVLQTKEGGYASLMEPAAGVDCKGTGLKRIEPFEPDQSLAILKLSDAPPCGERMPIALVAGALAPEDVEQLRAWVERGAPDD